MISLQMCHTSRKATVSRKMKGLFRYKIILKGSWQPAFLDLTPSTYFCATILNNATTKTKQQAYEPKINNKSHPLHHGGKPFLHSKQGQDGYTHTTMDNVLYLGGLMILNRSRKNNNKSASFVWLDTWSLALWEEYSLKVVVKRPLKTTNT